MHACTHMLLNITKSWTSSCAWHLSLARYSNCTTSPNQFTYTALMFMITYPGRREGGGMYGWGGRGGGRGRIPLMSVGTVPGCGLSYIRVSVRGGSTRWYHSHYGMAIFYIRRVRLWWSGYSTAGTTSTTSSCTTATILPVTFTLSWALAKISGV